MSFSCYLIGADTLLLECGNLLLAEGHTIRGVVTGAEKVRAWAAEKEIPCLSVDEPYAATLRQNPFDFLFAITHLAILPADVLALPKRGAVNFHDGPLPTYAGLNTPVWALLRREPRYGITWHAITAGVDEGDILKQRLFDVSPNETSLTLNTRNFEAAIETFGELIAELDAGTETRTPQDVTGRHYFRRHDRPECAGFLDFTKPAAELEALVRALDFGAYENPIYLPKFWRGDETWLVTRAEVVGEADLDERGLAADGEPGEVVAADGEVWIRTSEGVLSIAEAKMLCGSDDGRSVAEKLRLAVGERAPEVPAELRERLATEDKVLARSESFWEKRLIESTPAELVLAQPGRAGEAPFEAVIPYPSLPPSLAGRAPATVALAALGLYLGRTSGHDAFTVACATPELAELGGALAGLVASRVPLGFVFHPEQTFEQLVAAVAGEVETIAAKRSFWKDLVPRKPELRARPELTRGVVSPVAVRLGDAATAPSGDFLLEITFTDSELRVRYPRGVFPEGAPRLEAQLAATLANACGAPDARCDAVSLLSEEDRELVLRDRNRTEAAVDETSCVHQLFERQVAATPDAVALVFQDRSLTYAELNARANGLAATLREKGVGPDQLVGVMVERSLDLLVATLGVMKAGGAYVPLDPAYPADRLAYMLEDSGAKWVVTEAAHRSAVPNGVEAVLVGSSAALTAENPNSGVRSNHLAYVIYTSGSTGRPKGVMVEHRNAVNFFEGMDPVIPHEGRRVWMSVTSLSFDISVLELFWTLSRGFTVVLHRDENKAAGTTSFRLSAGRPVGFSFFLWGADDQASTNKYDLMLHAARFADSEGFSAVWTPERHFHAFGGPYPNPSVTSAAIAAVTSKIQIRAGSCVAPLHHPVRIAEEWAVVDNLSQGRVGISFASGWQPDDFLLKPDNFKENKRIMVEMIEQVRRLWRGEALEFENPLGNKVSIVTQPRPVQKELPFWVTTAGNPDTFRIAGQSGGNLLTHLLGQTFEELESKIRVYREGRASVGLDPDTGIVSLMLHTFVGADEGVVKERVREPMKHYLRSSVNLIKGFAWAFPAFKKPAKGGGDEIDIGALTDDDLDTILEFAFERYYETSGLFGTVESCLETVEKARKIGVDDIACLIDFGVPTELVKESLAFVGRLRSEVDAQLRTASAPVAVSHDSADYSLAALARAHEVTHLQCTPSLMRMALLDPETKDALFAIPHLMVGGEAMPLTLAEELANRAHGTLTNMYGPTETTIWSSTHRFARDPKNVPLGRPIVNTQLYVLDRFRQPVPIGVPGELYIGGQGVVRGYHKRPELTDERFVPNPFAGGRMYRTGDLVRWSPEGELEFLGRTDHQVKIRGHRIELGEIEALVVADEGVDEGVVVAREDTPGDLRIVAYFTGKANAEALREKLREELPEFMVPSAFVQLPRMPHTPNGKIDRKSLPVPDSARASVEEAAPPESELESTVADLWKQVLGLEEVGVTQNFFDLGGHSLLVVRLHQLLKKALNPAIPMTALYRFPTIRGFVESLNDGDSSEAAKAARDRGQQRRDQLSRRRNLRPRA